jgi:hypothetical protein
MPQATVNMAFGQKTMRRCAASKLAIRVATASLARVNGFKKRFFGDVKIGAGSDFI